MMDVRWIGREGEKIFDLLCTRNMVTCNKAGEDDRGWDFIIHYPAPLMPRVPIDQRSTGPTALVQIKATRLDPKRWSITLKNALSLARSPLPAFIVCVGLASDGSETIRAVHVWKDDIGRILKAAREAHAENDEATNRRTISFDIGEETTRADVLGWMLKEIETIGEDGYAAAKQSLVDNLGFENGHGTVRLRLSTASPNALEDLQLGILENVDLDYFSFTPSRFGIESSSPTIEAERGTLEIIPQGRRGTLRVRSPDGQQELLPAEVFSTVLPGHRRTKGRIKAGCLEVIIRSKGRFSVKSALAHDKPTSLDDIGAFALLRQSTRNEPLTIGLKTRSSFQDFGYINTKRPAEIGWQQIYLIIEALRAVIAFEDALPLCTTINGLKSEFVPLSVLDALVAQRTLRIEFTPHEEGEGEVGAFLAYASACLDGIEIGAVARRPVVLDEMIGSRRRIDFGPATILHAAIGMEDAKLLPDLYMDQLDRLSAELDVLAIGDLQLAVSRDADEMLVVDRPRAGRRQRTRAIN